MKILKLSAETPISELAGQAFKLRANASAKAAEAATAALLKANPQLANLTSLPKGTTVIVPVVSGLEAAKEAEPAAQAGTDLLEDLGAAVDATHQRLTAVIKKTQQETEETLELAQSKELLALLKRTNPEAVGLLKDIETSAKQQAEETKAQTERLNEALTEMRKDLKEFARRLQ